MLTHKNKQVRGIWMIAIILQTSAISSQAGVWLKRTVSIEGHQYAYQVYLNKPETKLATGSNQPLKVVLFLHGAGERGSDNHAQTTVGLGPFLKSKNSAPILAVFPQCAATLWWSDKSMELMAIAALEESIKEFKANSDDVTLTGLSMGGYGALNMAVNFPNKFKRVVAMSSRLRPPKGIRPEQGSLAQLYPDDAIFKETAKRLCHLSVRLFHGHYDQVVPVTESRQLYQALKAKSCSVWYTEYPKGGHAIWQMGYEDLWLSSWLSKEAKTQ